MNQVIENESSTSMTKLDGAVRALAEASSLEDVKHIADVAEAARTYAKAARLGLKAQNKAAEIHLRAQRKAGEMLAQMDKGKGGRPPKTGSSVEPVSTPLNELGITKQDSHRWQRIAALPEEAFEAHLQEVKESNREITTASVLAKERELSNGFRNATLGEVTVTCTENLQALISSGTPFATIYADPPWKYDNQATRAATDNHYPTMTVDELCELPIERLAASNAHLHLWTTNAFQFEAKQVMEAWGFEYKSTFVWVKPQMGIGNYWRVAHEYLLLGVRGSCTFMDKSLKSWAEFERTEHSAKPEAVREMIERASPAPRLELFARSPVEGWTVWGNQIEQGIVCSVDDCPGEDAPLNHNH